MLGIIFAGLLMGNLSIATDVAPASDSHPSSYIAKGACPFECCSYRQWSVTKRTTLYSEPDERSKKIGVLNANDLVNGVTGEVHSTAVRFIVTQPHDSYKVGDVVWVYNYGGEGFFNVWRNGKMDGEDLRFSPYGGSNGTRCEVAGLGCWGTLEHDLKFVWWVNVKDKSGIKGWSNQPDHFGNKDACG